MERPRSRYYDTLFTYHQEMFRDNPVDVVGRIERLFDIQDPHDSVSTICQYVEAGAYPFVLANHLSLSDTVALALLTSHVVEDTKIKGFRIPAGVSLSEGADEMMTFYYGVTTPVLVNRRGLEPILVTRGKEKKHYSIKDLRPLLKSPREKYGIAEFPEGEMEGGRPDDVTGLPKGLQEPKLSLLPHLGKNRNAVIAVLPVAFEGSDKVLSPVDNKPSYEALRILTAVDPERAVARMTLGEVEYYDSKEKNLDYFMRRVASMLPPEARGVYSD